MKQENENITLNVSGTLLGLSLIHLSISVMRSSSYSTSATAKINRASSARARKLK